MKIGPAILGSSCSVDAEEALAVEVDSGGVVRAGAGVGVEAAVGAATGLGAGTGVGVLLRGNVALYCDTDEAPAPEAERDVEPVAAPTAAPYGFSEVFAAARVGAGIAGAVAEAAAEPPIGEEATGCVGAATLVGIAFNSSIHSFEYRFT